MSYLSYGVLRPGLAGVDDTLRRMSAMAQQAAAFTPAGPSMWSQISIYERPRVLRQFLAEHFQFEPDPPGTERVRHPAEMLDSMARGEDPVRGDCDDAAVLGAALALAMGMRVRWRILRFGDSPDYEHVFAEVAPPEGGEWFDLDVTRPDALPGLLQGMRIHSRTVDL